MEEPSNSKERNIIKKGAWILISASIFSCLARNDYNIIGGISILIITCLFYNKYPKLILKISIHIYIGLCILDLIWLIIMMFIWEDSS